MISTTFLPASDTEKVNYCQKYPWWKDLIWYFFGNELKTQILNLKSFNTILDNITAVDTYIEN